MLDFVATVFCFSHLLHIRLRPSSLIILLYRRNPEESGCINQTERAVAYSQRPSLFEIRLIPSLSDIKDSNCARAGVRANDRPDVICHNTFDMIPAFDLLFEVGGIVRAVTVDNEDHLIPCIPEGFLHML